MKQDNPFTGRLSSPTNRVLPGDGVQNNFTAYTLTEEQSAKEAELQDFVENANICMHWVDEHGFIRWANRAELDMLGYSADEYIGHHITEFHLHRHKIDDILNRLRCNEKLHKYESELVCRDGSVKTVQINSSVYRDHGKFIHTRCITIDVTEEKRLLAKLSDSEARYRELANTLENKVQEKTKDLTGITEELKASEDRLKESLSLLEFQNKELEQFVYAASHDLKEPLRKITIYSNYIIENSSNKLDERSKDYLNRSINAVTRMRSLIEDLLVYSKSTSVGERYETIDLNGILHEIADQYKDTLDQVAGQLTTGNLPAIQGVRFQIQQLFYNLIDNAVKYRFPERPLVIKVQSEVIPAGEIKNADVAYQQYFRISIADNGMGFNAQYSYKIFEIFQRLHSKTQIPGTGIGLAICKKIVQNHHGFIDAVAEPDKGATFNVYLPVI
jgi:PAS domain S-box-containing protein